MPHVSHQKNRRSETEEERGNRYHRGSAYREGAWIEYEGAEQERQCREGQGFN